MIDTDAAETLARALLEEALPHRWTHSWGVAATARTLAPVIGPHADAVIAAAWLHDIGYAPTLHHCGFHPLDGARYLRDVQHADPLVCQLVAHHSCAAIEAIERGLAADLFGEFRPPSRDLADALIYCDMTTGPRGQPMTVEQRLTEIGHRYGSDHVVSRALAQSAPELAAAVVRVMRKLATCSPIAATHAGGRVPGDGGSALAEVGAFAVLGVMLDT
jgi:putative nucleotidyltransferase with HDIG domain